MAIPNDQLEAGIIKGTLVPRAKMFAAKVDNLPIEVDHDYLLDAGVTQHFARTSAFSTADDDDAAWVGMQTHCRLHQCFVIDVFIVLDRLQRAVEQKGLPKVGELHYLDLLVFGLFRDDRARAHEPVALVLVGKVDILISPHHRFGRRHELLLFHSARRGDGHYTHSTEICDPPRSTRASSC